MVLPIFTTDDKDLSLLQTNWSKTINPVVDAVQNRSTILSNVKLISGTNTINHKLGQKLQGWKIVRQRSAATFYDNQDTNLMPQLTLVLVASANVVVDIEVF